eukprot:CAMPEP_0172398984 /NCGR_PEP_ID=MMETSP1061-20121228/38704_1 /TAXON_ID=37318 /ORGANISM="Pseudo-nitzschia pungens, Strain cf. pungens" /LENGTH=582 /DNA_ID=CAMNT_0013131707 /DNA_START=51 /DNA_END=1799 /DNA_ORIENTATION=-
MLNQNKAAWSPRRRERNQGPSLFPWIRRETTFLIVVTAFILFVFGIEIVMFHQLESTQKGDEPFGSTKNSRDLENDDSSVEHGLPEYLLPTVPILPLFDSVENANDYIASLMEGRPSMTGIIALLQKFLAELHEKNRERMKADEDGNKVFENFYALVAKYLEPFDTAYRGQNIFPVRSDESIFISLAAFREHLLTETLVSAFKHAKNPDKVFVGAVIQNCFGKQLDDGTIDTSGTPCLTGPKKTGELQPNGKPVTKRMEVPPDVNGVEKFCGLPEYAKYCDNGQIRVVYIYDTDSQGPSMARYYASKLWGGETYVMQIDAHLRFADQWDAKYIEDIKLTKNYPKSVLSTYPPGFDQLTFVPKSMKIDRSKTSNDTVIESPGCRLCGCGIPHDGKDGIIHINQGVSYHGDEKRPTQQPFLGAGYVFFRAEFLKDIPFDPYLPWTFMGEEILLSMRAWTNGWNIYAPRRNLIIHQYRPGALGIPKFVGAVNSQAKKGFGNGWLQKKTVRRIKNLCGYPLHTTEKIEADGESFVLVNKEHYGLGTVRSWDDYMELGGLKVNTTTGAIDCAAGKKGPKWCNQGLVE